MILSLPARILPWIFTDGELLNGGYMANSESETAPRPASTRTMESSLLARPLMVATYGIGFRCFRLRFQAPADLEY